VINKLTAWNRIRVSHDRFDAHQACSREVKKQRLRRPIEYIRKVVHVRSIVARSLINHLENDVPAWSCPEEQGTNNESEASRLDRLDDILERSVRDRLVADVPVGVFLSGGIDSSLIAAIVSRHAPGLTAFTLSMPGGVCRGHFKDG
jgi:asparagine synthetase B (glutamine-hydrolysing)